LCGEVCMGYRLVKGARPIDDPELEARIKLGPGNKKRVLLGGVY